MYKIVLQISMNNRFNLQTLFSFYSPDLCRLEAQVTAFFLEPGAAHFKLPKGLCLWPSGTESILLLKLSSPIAQQHKIFNTYKNIRNF